MDYKNMSKEELIEYIKKLNEDQTGKYGLIWDREKQPEETVFSCNKYIPVLKHIENKDINCNGSIENILIEGDNFHSLSALHYTHKEAIDVIYIDPPYNTGKEFIYNDDLVNEEDGYRHSKWLNFMQKRLKLGKELLKSTGVIFISIDDNEQAQLKLLCDSIFGEINFVSSFVVIRAEGGGLAKQVIKGHDYLLVYCKDISEFSPLAKEKDIRGKKVISEGIEYWVQEDWLRKEFGKYGNCHYEELLTYKDKKTKEAIDKGLEEGKYQLIKKDNGLHIIGKLRRIDEDSSKFYSILKHLNKDGVIDLKKFDLEESFDYPKPVSLIKELVLGATFFIKKKKPIILDFFAGSGTTGQAVLELNKKDGGNRQFILCTNNENEICDKITYPRLKQCILGSKNIEKLGTNLKYFKTDFVENVGTRDQLYYDLTEKCIPMLCLKEETFEKLDLNEEYAIYTNKENSKYTCVYFDIFGNKYEEFKRKLEEIEEQKSLYIFALGDYVNTNDLKDVKNYTIEAIPYRILDLYKKVIKMSKED